ncbi:LacI family DNA-binding transcriptional regulator [Bacillus testis]|uniref:LacI family DNA-binding transcriptional regulator n=1 Tax=Bacillus testis TaxID=1622072 RepID=UPI00067E6DB2|nr:LacI family DNA-binding transcriptional regulator [Bacillus testis]
MATIKDVAKHSGVSVATVSRVLNGKGYVHEDTRKKVERSIQQLEYSPNEVARSLYKKESRLIGLLLPDITNPFFPQLARGVEDEIQRNGYHLLSGNSDEKTEKEIAYIQTFMQHNVVGLISASNHVARDYYNGIEIPKVFLDRCEEGLYCVYSDGFEGGRMAAEEILKRGSRNITLLKGPANVKPAQERFQGALDILASSSVDFHVVNTPSFSFEYAKERAYELFSTYPDSDGIIASNDITAAAVLHEALRLGKKIPEEVQIIGYDDIPQSSLLFPALSTIRQPTYDMGVAAAKMLLQKIRKQSVVEQHVKMPVTFMERNTTRKVK